MEEFAELRESRYFSLTSCAISRSLASTRLATCVDGAVIWMSWAAIRASRCARNAISSLSVVPSGAGTQRSNYNRLRPFTIYTPEFIKRDHVYGS